MQSHPGIYQVTETLQQGKPPVRTILYYQGTRGRTQQGALITLFLQDKIYQLRPTEKIYRSIAVAQLRPGQAPEYSNAKVQASSRKGGQRKTIAGEKAQSWLIQSTALLDMKALAQKAPTEAERRQFPKSLTVKMSVENWLSERDTLAPSVQYATAALAGSQNPMGQMMQPLLSAASKQHGIPLTTTLRVTFATTPPQKNALNGTVVVTTRTLRLEHKSLPDSLFAVPPDYKEVPWDKWQ